MNNKGILKEYIYYKQNNWNYAKNNLIHNLAEISNESIINEYNKNAVKLESNLGKIPENLIENVKELLDFKSPYINKINNNLNLFFLEVQSFITELPSYILNSSGMTIGQGSQKLKKMTLSIKESRETIETLKKVMDEINKFDEGFKSINPTHNSVSFINAEGMKKTKIAYEKIESFLNKHSNLSNNVTILGEEVSSILGSLLGDLKGGLFEYADFIHSKAISQCVNSISEQISVMDDVSLQLDDFTKNIIFDIDKNKFSSKANNVVTVFGYDENNVEFNLDLGIIDKSYLKSRAGSKIIASNINWLELMNEAEVYNSNFEWYYSNLIVHEQESINSSSNLYNRYLAAKASSFLISGKYGEGAQAYFIRYGNDIVYIPDILKGMKGDRGLFKLIPTGNITNSYIGKNPNLIDGFIRTKNTISNLRSNFSFNALR